MWDVQTSMRTLGTVGNQGVGRSADEPPNPFADENKSSAIFFFMAKGEMEGLVFPISDSRGLEE